MHLAKGSKELFEELYNEGNGHCLVDTMQFVEVFPG
jgi:hypothetical protein